MLVQKSESEQIEQYLNDRWDWVCKSAIVPTIGRATFVQSTFGVVRRKIQEDPFFLEKAYIRLKRENALVKQKTLTNPNQDTILSL